MIFLDHLKPTQLLEGCRNTKPDRSHEQFCLELFRRAIVEKSQACWSALHEQYIKLVFRWTIDYAKNNRSIGNIPIEEMVQDAFTGFWRSYTENKLKKADSLSSVLQYLKSCAWSAVQHAIRQVDEPTIVPLDDLIETRASQTYLTLDTIILSEITVQQFWSVVDSCCNDDRERMIARLRFINGWKPQDIVRYRPDLATDEKEIFKLLRNLKDRIERSVTMRKFYEELAQ